MPSSRPRGTSTGAARPRTPSTPRSQAIARRCSPSSARPASTSSPTACLPGRTCSGRCPPVALQLTFCDARVALENGLAELPVEGIGVDFYLTHLTDLPRGIDKLLLAGVVDARSSTVEDADELAGFAQRLQDEREVE